ncbi:putative thiosulfate sulfurtransferase precursor [Phycisphaerae bacterium RAS1]|nr:putative thiosulfate sulfurtransferase precursor [Phycisphaerae bacterium RAS1]
MCNIRSAWFILSAGVAGCALVFSSVGCAKPRVAGDGFVMQPELIDSELAAAQEEELLPIILDVRPQDQYETSHLAGAQQIDAAEWTRLSREDANSLREVAAWQARVGALGIGPKDAVYIYDDGHMLDAARVWFILQQAGVRNAAVIDGGFPAISTAVSAARLTSAASLPPRPKKFAVSTRGGPVVPLADAQQVRRRSGDRTDRVLDVRSPGEFSGKDARKNPRGGHVPDALNIPHSKFVNENGRLKSNDEIRRILEQAGLRPGEAMTVHCQSGGRSSLAALAIARSGFGPVSHYYMSFEELARDEKCTLIGAAEK